MMNIKTAELRADRFNILVAYRRKLKELRDLGVGNQTKHNTIITAKLINIICKRYEELQVKWRVYGSWDT